MLIFATSAIALSGIGFAVYKYSRGGFSESWEKRGIYKLLINQYYIPKFYELTIQKPLYNLSKFAWQKIDLKIVDATVDMIARVLYGTGNTARKIQSGNLSSMLRWMVAGIAILLVLAIFIRPMV